MRTKKFVLKQTDRRWLNVCTLKAAHLEVEAYMLDEATVHTYLWL